MAENSIRYPGCAQVAVSGRLSARFRGNQRYLESIYETRKDWMLEPFQNRGKVWVLEPLRNGKGELPWAGEYAGKWLDAASLSAPFSCMDQLGGYARTFSAALIAAQEPDGYLGIEVPEKRGGGAEWDVWNVKYAMTGLLTHYEVYHDQASLQTAEKCGEWLLNQYGLVSGTDHPFFLSSMEGGVNVSILDQIARLYRYTGNRSFLEFASAALAWFPPIARMRSTLQAPLWHAYNLMGYLGGVVELGIADSRVEELQWVERVWEDLTSRHVYPTGSLGYNELLGETAPNDTPVEDGQPGRHHQETCATVEWLLFNALLYQATGRVRYVEKMEQTIYNALLAAQSEDGMKWMYFTPLRYEKRWFTGPTSCCYWSGPRGVARIPGWVYALDGEGIRVNLYESSEASFLLDKCAVVVRQSSLYPELGNVALNVEPEMPLNMTLQLRIPPGVNEVQIKLNGRALPAVSVEAGYVVLNRKWSKGDQVVMEFDIPVSVNHFLNDNYGIIVRGPEVLAVDQKDNPSLDLDQIMLREGILLRSTDPVKGRRRYKGETCVSGQLVPIVFTSYADSGGESTRFRTAFPLL